MSSVRNIALVALAGVAGVQVASAHPLAQGEISGAVPAGGKSSALFDFKGSYLKALLTD